MRFFFFLPERRTCRICVSLPGLLPLTLCPPVPSILPQMRRFCSFFFFMTRNVLLSTWPTLSGRLRLLVDGLLEPVSWSLCVMLPGTWGCRLFAHAVVAWLGHMLFPFFSRASVQFSLVAILIDISANCVEESPFKCAVPRTSDPMRNLSLMFYIYIYKYEIATRCCLFATNLLCV